MARQRNNQNDPSCFAKRFANFVSTKTLDCHSLFRISKNFDIRDNRHYHICEIYRDNREIEIIADAKKGDNRNNHIQPGSDNRISRKIEKNISYHLYQECSHIAHSGVMEARSVVIAGVFDAHLVKFSVVFAD
jgi:hypothetical protein